VESVLGSGSVFTIRLPADVKAAAPVTGKSAPVQTAISREAQD